MDKQIIAIGGGGFGRNPGNGTIEKYILDQANSEKPNICFILPTLVLKFVIVFSDTKQSTSWKTNVIFL